MFIITEENYLSSLEMKMKCPVMSFSSVIVQRYFYIICVFEPYIPTACTYKTTIQKRHNQWVGEKENKFEFSTEE